MTALPSDALVLFGVTGDLAYRKIFPALSALAARGELALPVIGMAREGWSRERLLARVRESLRDAGEVDARGFSMLAERLLYVYPSPYRFFCVPEMTSTSAGDPPKRIVDSVSDTGCAPTSSTCISQM